MVANQSVSGYRAGVCHLNYTPWKGVCHVFGYTDDRIGPATEEKIMSNSLHRHYSDAQLDKFASVMLQIAAVAHGMYVHRFLYTRTHEHVTKIYKLMLMHKLIEVGEFKMKTTDTKRNIKGRPRIWATCIHGPLAKHLSTWPEDYD